MANMIQSAKDSINDILKAAYEKAVAAGELPACEGGLPGSVEIPKDSANGDFAANHAMAGARALHMAPRKIADTLEPTPCWRAAGLPRWRRRAPAL